MQCDIRQSKLAKFYTQKPEVYFTEIKVMIYVFDVNFVKDEELEMFAKTSELLEKYSPDAKLFVLIHKMDTIKPQRKEETLKERKETISKVIPGSLEVSEFFGTSIWDVTLYNVSFGSSKGMEQDHSDFDPQPGLLEQQFERNLQHNRMRRDHSV